MSTKSDLKIEITPIESFNVKIEGVDMGRFSIVSSWEGLTKLKGDNGIIIVSTNDHDAFHRVFSEIFRSNMPSQVSVVKISPKLIPFDTMSNKGEPL